MIRIPLMADMGKYLSDAPPNNEDIKLKGDWTCAFGFVGVGEFRVGCHTEIESILLLPGKRLMAARITAASYLQSHESHHPDPRRHIGRFRAYDMDLLPAVYS
jgi:hypothetical protein